MLVNHNAKQRLQSFFLCYCPPIDENILLVTFMIFVMKYIRYAVLSVPFFLSHLLLISSHLKVVLW